MMITFLFVVFFYFKQKTAYDMRISDWSSDVCSSDLLGETQDDEVLPRRRGVALVGRKGQRLVRPDRDDGHDDDREDDEDDPAPGETVQESEMRAADLFEIGRESCRERVCQSV